MLLLLLLLLLLLFVCCPCVMCVVRFNQLKNRITCRGGSGDTEARSFVAAHAEVHRTHTDSVG